MDCHLFVDQRRLEKVLCSPDLLLVATIGQLVIHIVTQPKAEVSECKSQSKGGKDVVQIFLSNMNLGA